MPRVLKDLFLSTKRQYVWEDFSGGAKGINEGNAGLFVTQILLAPEREIPVVVVSRCSKSGNFVVDPHELAKSLAGLAVVFCSESKDTYLLSDALREANIDARALGCFDGGVRMYMPEFHGGSDPYRHTLWTRTFLETKAPNEQIKLIARKVASYSVGLRVPQGFARTIEDFDLKNDAEQSSRTAESGEVGEHVAALRKQVKGLQEALDRLKGEAEQVNPLRVQIEQANDRTRYIQGLNQLMERELGSLTEDKDALQRRVHNLKAQIDQLESLRRESESTSVFLGSELIDGLIRNSWSPIGSYVRLLQARYPERVVFLPEALDSAD
jgi:hypothetical protein